MSNRSTSSLPAVAPRFRDVPDRRRDATGMIPTPIFTMPPSHHQEPENQYEIKTFHSSSVPKDSFPKFLTRKKDKKTPGSSSSPHVNKIPPYLPIARPGSHSKPPPPICPRIVVFHSSQNEGPLMRQQGSRRTSRRRRRWLS